MVKANSAKKQERQSETPNKRALQERKYDFSILVDAAVNAICIVKMHSTGMQLLGKSIKKEVCINNKNG